MRITNKRGRPRLTRDPVDKGTPELCHKKSVILGQQHLSSPCQNMLDILYAQGHIPHSLMGVGKWIMEIHYKSRNDVQLSTTKTSSHEQGWIVGYYDGRGQEQNREFSSKTKWFDFWEEIEKIMHKAGEHRRRLLIQSLTSIWSISDKEIQDIKEALIVIYRHLTRNLRRR